MSELTAQQRLEIIKELLDDSFYPEEMRYDTQGVNQAHRVAAGGVAPRKTEPPHEP